MDHEPVFIATIAIGLTAAFVGGLVARRLGLPSIVGYIVAGIAIGPFTPGLTADREIAAQLAEIGVILLMFGVGIHFSFRDLLAVRAVAIPGALVQIVIAILGGIGLGLILGWGIGGGLVLGLAISVASTVVLLRALGERNELDTPEGRLSIGWLIVEDVLIILVLVLLPTISPLLGGAAVPGAGDPLAGIVIALGKAALFAGLMLFVGARLVPRLLLYAAREDSRELFTLGVLAIALGVAFAASSVFGVSLALGAFLAGAVVGESDMSHQAAADALPLRDAFAVLFFVSVGMLLEPMFLADHVLQIAAVVGLVVVGKWVVKFAIVAVFGYPIRTALTVASGLAQIGEFSFILGTVGLSLELLPAEGFQMIVAAALISITVNPLVFRLIEPLSAWLRQSPRMTALTSRRAGDLARLGPDHSADTLTRHAIVCGYGRVGAMVAGALERRGFRYVVITQDRREIDGLRARDIPAIYGDAANAELLERAHIRTARLLIVAIADVHATRLIVEHARKSSEALEIVARTHSDVEAAHLRAVGGGVQAVHGERELAIQMTRHALRRFGVSGAEAEAIAQGLRGRSAVRVEVPPSPLALARLVAAIRRRIRADRPADPAVSPAPAPRPDR